jgi:PBP1b-binding outer membrane lipoprotein LpoB
MIKLIKISSLLTVAILLNSCVSENKEVDAAPKKLKEDTAKISTKQKYIGTTDASWKQCYDTFKG